MKPYDVLIIGAGVSGSALLYMLSKYTDVKDICVLEKYSAPARVNSDPTQNSQTLHCGDIETNYTLKKAHVTRRATNMLRTYALSQPNAENIIYKFPKMVIGVGEEECELLRQRFLQFSDYYPNLGFFTRKTIEKIEPNVIRGRDDKEIVALGSTDEYTAINFEALTHSFIEQAQTSEKNINISYNQQVEYIFESDGVFTVKTQNGITWARSIAVCAGAHSLKIAHDMGYGLNFSVLPVAGNYYFTPNVLNGKVYTVQNDALPFAAVHGDPDVVVPGVTRFGPTAVVLPMLERYNIKSVSEFIDVFRFDKNVAGAFWKLLKVKDIRNYMMRNVLLGMPGIGKMLFLQDARKIVPTLKLRDLTFATRFGGVRPQLIEKCSRDLQMGEARIDLSDGIIFNMTPSPGGTSCIENAQRDMRSLMRHIDGSIDEIAIMNELGE